MKWAPVHCTIHELTLTYHKDECDRAIFRQSKKKKRQQDGKEKDSGKKDKDPKKIADAKSQDRVAQLKSQDGPKRGHGAESEVGKMGSGTDRPDSGLTNRVESAVAEDGK